MFRLPFLVLFGLISANLQAHDLWVERDDLVHSLSFGHERSGHEGARKLEYKPETVKQAECFALSGQEIKAERGMTFPATLKGDCAASWFLLSSGYWSKTPYGSKNLPKTEAGAVMDSWLSIESVKRIDRWSEALARPLTRELELVPTNNPLLLKAGGKLRLRAHHQGKPVANVAVSYFGKPRGATGDDGTINIRLAEPGFQLVQASLELALGDGKADKTIHSTALQFKIR